MPYDEGNRVWKLQLQGTDRLCRGLLRIVGYQRDRDGNDTVVHYTDSRWPGKPRSQHFETLYDRGDGFDSRYFLRIGFALEFTDDDYARELTPTQAAQWLLEEGYEVPPELRTELPCAHSIVENGGQSRSTGKMKALTNAQAEVWDLLENRAMPAFEIAMELLDDRTGEDAMRKRIFDMNKAGWRVLNKRGRGYYRPDAPAPGFTIPPRDSG